MLSRKEEIERSIITKFRKDVWRKFTKAVCDYQLIKDGDKIAVCISGGKDSMLLAKCMEELRKHGKANFEICYIVMNPGYRSDVYEKIVDNAKVLGIDIKVFKSNIFEIVDKQVASPCYLCARMRRGFLYARIPAPIHNAVFTSFLNVAFLLLCFSSGETLVVVVRNL